MSVVFWKERNSTLKGLDALELGRLRMSVGYGTHKNMRPLSPIEVGNYLRRVKDAEKSNSECAEVAQVSVTQVSRFLRILNLPSDIHHLIGWAGKGSISFSDAVELLPLKSARDQRIVAKAILETDLDKKEIRQIGQLRARTKRPIEQCIKRILEMRPIIKKRQVVIGSIADQNTLDILSGLAQVKRNSILEFSVEKLGLPVTSGHLGMEMFTLVGDEALGAAVKKMGADGLEKELRIHIGRIAKDVARGHS